jgi:hypothetical protein
LALYTGLKTKNLSGEKLPRACAPLMWLEKYEDYNKDHWADLDSNKSLKQSIQGGVELWLEKVWLKAY